MGIKERLKKLEEANPPTCKGSDSPCQQPIAWTQVEYIKGREVLVDGTPPEPLCESCPQLAMREPPIREIRVVLNAYSEDAPDHYEKGALVWP